MMTIEVVVPGLETASKDTIAVTRNPSSLSKQNDIMGQSGTHEKKELLVQNRVNT